MHNRILKYIPTSNNRPKRLAVILRTKNYKYFGSLPLDSAFSKCLKVQHLKVVKFVRFDLSSCVQRSRSFCKSNALKKCQSLAIKNFQKDYSGKIKLNCFLKRVSLVNNFSIEIDVGFDFVQSNPYFLTHPIIKNLRLKNLSVHLLEYGNNLELNLLGDHRRNMFQNILKEINRQRNLRTLILNFSDYNVESNYSFELEKVNTLLQKFPHLSYLGLGQPIGSSTWDNHTSKKLLQSLSKLKELEALNLVFDEGNGQMDSETVNLLREFSKIKKLKVTMYVTKSLLRLIHKMQKAFSELNSLNLIIYIKQNQLGFWNVLGSWFRNFRTLQHLTFDLKSHIPIQEAKIKSLLEGIAQLNKLKTIDLKGPYEGSSNSLLVLLLKAISTLERLDKVNLECYGYTPVCGDKDMRTILNEIEIVSSKLNNLQLIFGPNKTSEHTLELLEKALIQAKDLREFELVLRPSNLSNKGLEILKRIVEEKKTLNKIVIDIEGKSLSKDLVKGLVKSMISSVKIGKAELTILTNPAFKKEELKEIRSFIKNNSRRRKWIAYFPVGFKYQQISLLKGETIYEVLTSIYQSLMAIISHKSLFSGRQLFH